MLKPPQFWEKPLSFQWKLLSWVSRFFGYLVQKRLGRTPFKIPVPVICVGNLSLGGTGKTPLALFLARYFLKKGKKVGFLSRGYGGKIKGPLRVNTQHHSSKEVGDEPLLLAALAPTWVSRDRVAGACAMVKKGINLIIMDDGHQNPFLYKDVSLVVVDGLKGFGNKEVFPLGPLREGLEGGLGRADAVVVIRSPSDALKKDLKLYEGVIVEADIILNIKKIPAQKLVAFCGIGNSDKFFTSLKKSGAEIVVQKAFSDHYHYTFRDLQSLRKIADSCGAILVTTQKDWVRLDKKDQKDILPLPIDLKWKKWGEMEKLLAKKIPE